MSEDDFWDNLDGIEDMDVSDEMLEKAYDNSFRILTENLSFKELLAEDIENNVEYTVVMHDVDKGFNKETIEAMIDWYVGFEEYEKCATLHKMIK